MAQSPSCRKAVLNAYRQLRARRATDGQAYRSCVQLYCLRTGCDDPAQACAMVARWIGAMHQRRQDFCAKGA